MNKILFGSFLLAHGASSFGQTLMTDNFDSSPLGNVAGSNGWYSASPNFNVVMGGFSRPTPTSGSQMLEIDAGGSDILGNFIQPAWDLRNAGNNLLIAEVDVYTASSDLSGRSINIAITGNTGHLLADLGLTLSGDNFFSYSALSGLGTGPALTRDTWHHLAIALNSDTHTSALLVDGTQFATVAYDSTEGINSFAVDSFTSPSVNSQAAAYFDTAHVQAVPEPSAFLALGLPLLALRKRKSSTR